MTNQPVVSAASENRNSSSDAPENGVVAKLESNYDRSSENDANLSVITRPSESSLILSNDINLESKEGESSTLTPEPLVSIVASQEKSSGNVVDLKPIKFPPLWGVISVCGRRSEMEDSLVALPRFLNIPSRMLSGSPLLNSIDQELSAHVFGVYDGHGGSQVANYCREHLHVALGQEIETAKQNSHIEIDESKRKEVWMKIFLNCFHKMDNKVGGFPIINDETPPGPPLAPDSVGSTAVVAIVCSTHIIVANCGDSRAVLCRGKESIPLSLDHKPDREDERARIEVAGGKVFNWDGYRVSGVLAMSRSIGDRHLRPYVIADPEIMLVSRMKEDECLILASDGLWDVMTNQEACDFVRRRMRQWYKKNGTTVSNKRGENIDPAAQDAADYLAWKAFQRGSIDNISVIVVDLNAQRKLKKKPEM